MNIPKEHPSYGLVGFSRITCSPPEHLFGSSIKHSNIIRLEIHESELERAYQQNRYYAGKRLITVDLSPIQFADLLTHMNVGQGIPCTIVRTQTDKENRPSPPDTSFTAISKQELKKEMNDLGEKIKILTADTKKILSQGGNIKKADKEKILKDIMFLEQEVNSNIPFAHECFQEACNATVSEAKAEIDATYVTVKDKLGEKALQEMTSFKALE